VSRRRFASLAVNAQRTLRGARWLPYALVLIAAMVIVLASLFLLGVLSQEGLNAYGVVVTALATLVVAVFAGWTLLSNADLIRASQAEADAAIRLVQQAEQDRVERRAKLELRFEKRFPMWWPAQNWVRVEVANSGPAMAANVTVILEEIRPVNPMESRGGEHNVLPSRLGWKGHEADHCDINPASREYFDVLKFIPATEPDKQAQVGFTTHESMDLVAGSMAVYDMRHNYEYLLVIVATAANAQPVRMPFVMKTDANGSVLSFEAGSGTLSWEP
jgi:hypothetical protein